eukprot:1157926-Pelagomonas_calceolata.AAC.6
MAAVRAIGPQIKRRNWGASASSGKMESMQRAWINPPSANPQAPTSGGPSLGSPLGDRCFDLLCDLRVLRPPLQGAERFLSARPLMTFGGRSLGSPLGDRCVDLLCLCVASGDKFVAGWVGLQVSFCAICGVLFAGVPLDAPLGHSMHRHNSMPFAQIKDLLMVRSAKHVSPLQGSQGVGGGGLSRGRVPSLDMCPRYVALKLDIFLADL